MVLGGTPIRNHCSPESVNPETNTRWKKINQFHVSDLKGTVENHSLLLRSFNCYENESWKVISRWNIQVSSLKANKRLFKRNGSAKYRIYVESFLFLLVFYLQHIWRKEMPKASLVVTRKETPTKKAINLAFKANIFRQICFDGKLFVILKPI